MIDYIVDKYGCDRERICMVGDRLDTDILFGQNNGLLSCLTLSGVTTETKLLSEGNQIKPDYYVDSIARERSVERTRAPASTPQPTRALRAPALVRGRRVPMR